MAANHGGQTATAAGAMDAHSSDAQSDRIEQLVRGCAERNEQALADLYQLVSEHLFGMLLRILKRRALAEEALQDVMVRVWQRADRYAAYRGRAMPWLISIARNRAIDLLRTEREHASIEEAPRELLADSANREISDTTIPLRFHAALAECMERLSPEQRRCIALAYLDGYSRNEIAETVGSPAATVRSWIRRGVASLRRCLEA
jgi:RNA polymerase sigma-70 factor, ECF subfamily